MSTLIINFKELLQFRNSSILKVLGVKVAILPTIKNAYLVLKNEIISDLGALEDLPNVNPEK